MSRLPRRTTAPLLALTASLLLPAAASAQVDPGILRFEDSKSKSQVHSVLRPEALLTALDDAVEWLLDDGSKWLPVALDANADFVYADISAVEGVEFGYEAPAGLASVEGVEFGYDSPEELQAALDSRLSCLPLGKGAGIEIVGEDGFVVSVLAFDGSGSVVFDAGFEDVAGALSTLGEDAQLGIGDDAQLGIGDDAQLKADWTATDDLWL